MFPVLRKHPTPSTLMAFVALVFALTGGAFAASGHGGGAGSKTTASTPRASNHAIVLTAASKSKSKAKSKTGARGPAGPAGKNGANGVNGAPGATGPVGPAGPTGGQGPQGPIGPQGPQGPQGPAGEQGKEGKTGYAETLPPGKTLTGEFSASAFTEEGKEEELAGTFATTAVNFPFRVENESKEGPLPHFIKAGETSLPKGCTGSAQEPGAEEGNLCVFATQETDIQESQLGHLICDLNLPSNQCTGFGLTRVNPDGFVIKSLPKEGGEAGHGQAMLIDGTWAVTAE
jgi:hypothetical protein